MAKTRLSIKTRDRTLIEGEISLPRGTTAIIRPKQAILNIDYTSPDGLAVTVEGEFCLGGLKDIDLCADLSYDILSGATSIEGSLEWQIDQDQSVRISVSSDPSDSRAEVVYRIEF